MFSSLVFNFTTTSQCDSKMVMYVFDVVIFLMSLKAFQEDQLLP